jgi:hypothetical protein
MYLYSIRYNGYWYLPSNSGSDRLHTTFSAELTTGLSSWTRRKICRYINYSVNKISDKRSHYGSTCIQLEAVFYWCWQVGLELLKKNCKLQIRPTVCIGIFFSWNIDLQNLMFSSFYVVWKYAHTMTTMIQITCLAATFWSPYLIE